MGAFSMSCRKPASSPSGPTIGGRGSAGTGFQLTDNKAHIYNHRVIRSIHQGNAVLVEVEYPDAVNYSGRKYLLFDCIRKYVRWLEKGADPHFLQKEDGPIARFRPTAEGWKLAMQMLSLIQ